MLNSVVTNQCPQLTLKTAMRLQTGRCHCFFLFLLFTLHLNPILAYFMKDCKIVYSDNVSAGVRVDCSSFQFVCVPDDIPSDVIFLSMYSNKIQKIRKTEFYHLSNLTGLDLRENSITHVDDGAFVPLVQLKELYIDNNKLTTLTDNMFQGLSNLLILTLDHNNIQFINPVAFQLLTSLQELSLSPNQITDIIPVLQLPSLQVLNITTDELESFQSKDLPLNLSSEIRQLRVDSQSIEKFSITTAVFPHLKTIDLSGCCNITGWEWDIPDKYILRNITTAYLTGSNISYNTIGNALQSLDSLENLQLGSEWEVYIGWIDRDLLNIICKIRTLSVLNMERSYINDSLSKTLSLCTQLTSLDLSAIGLTERCTDVIKQMKHLSHLDLSWNDISKVPDNVRNLSMLQILILHHNSIHDLSCSDFLNLTRLTHLILNFNSITEFKPCVFQHLNELKVLTLQGNSIQTLSNGEFISLKSLKQLDMEYDGWKGWDKNCFVGLDELETLSLNFYASGFISSLQQELQWQNYSPLLQRLTIQFGQQYYILSNTLLDMKHLEYLKVIDGQPDLDSFTDGQVRLETLILNKSNLTSLDFLAQANLTRLSWLDLRENELTMINVSVFSFLPALRYINMNNNPLACDCSNADFLQWMQNNNQTLVVDAQSYTCGFPLAKKDTRFLDFDYHSCFVDDSFICFILSTCVIVLTLLTSFTYHFLSLHLLYAYYLFLAFLYDAKERKRGSPERYDAFISYNVHDEPWVCREMLPVLEGEQGWRLCLHHRDFLPGKPIIENITDAIYGSRKTICVISPHYLESEWCSREFQMASYRLFDEQKDVLILVFLEDIPAHQLSPYYHMRRLMKSHTYLSWSQAGQHPGLFWQNLRRALDTPHTDLDLIQ